MREVHPTSAFRRDQKKLKYSKEVDPDEFNRVLDLLRNDLPLPERLRDHALTGQWKGARDCHITPDILLIYSKPPGNLLLLRLASHSELFG